MWVKYCGTVVGIGSYTGKITGIVGGSLIDKLYKQAPTLPGTCSAQQQGPRHLRAPQRCQCIPRSRRSALQSYRAHSQSSRQTCVVEAIVQPGGDNIDQDYQPVVNTMNSCY